MSTLASRSASRSTILSLYRRCLRTAFRCPSFEHQQTWAGYARLKFRERVHERDPAIVKRGVADALEQTERLEYYQAVATKAKDKHTSHAAPNLNGLKDRLPPPSAQSSILDLTSFFVDLRISEDEASCCEFLY